MRERLAAWMHGLRRRFGRTAPGRPLPAQPDDDQRLAHQFRTPLTIVQGYAEMLADGQLSDPLMVRSSAREILAGAQQMLRLLDNPSETLELRSVDPSAWLAEATRTFAQATPSHQVVADLPGALPTVRIDPRRLGRALEAVLADAARTSEPGSLILVSAHVFAAGSIEIHVVGQGTASPGLDAVRSVIEAHGGQMGTRSALGRGSTVWLRLPSEVAHVPSEPPVWIDLERVA